MKKIILNENSRQLVKEITAGLKEVGEVKVTGLGVFMVKERKERQGRNPKTGEAIIIPAGKKLKFRFSSTLKREVL